MNIQDLKIQVKKEIELAKDIKKLDNIFKKYLGKKGELALFLRSLKDLPEDKRKTQGKIANEIKKRIKSDIEEKRKEFQVSEYNKDDFSKQEFDITVPGKKPLTGHLHPLTIVQREIQEIFQNMGFSIVEGPEMETEWYNFDALNFPIDHPAREMQDTFFVKQENRENLGNKKKLVMRTQTSSVQIHYMEKNNPDLRIIVPGRVFRCEATDASHEVQFYQMEGLMVGKDISVANLKAVIQEFFSKFYNNSVKIRLRPSFFPFTEPSFEVDVSCVVCEGKGCSVCSQTGWIEIMGAGMVHPNVLKNSGLNPKHWQGLAFGMGLDRLVMMKYKIDDIRLFYKNDLRFLEQF
ncbi:MAG: phenylalanine--tRNA ligase subunit alpha [Patescibacteria group bacterium]|nr:phenylalanine--tRNA ligase subunit alpha [Patescibacteria group bacterium]